MDNGIIMGKIDPKDWLRITNFAKASGMTRQGVNKAMKEGRLKYQVVDGHKFIHKDNVEKFRKE
jgi:hypothetical protein